jgi:hypothetical protein
MESEIKSVVQGGPHSCKVAGKTTRKLLSRPAHGNCPTQRLFHVSGNGPRQSSVSQLQLVGPDERERMPPARIHWLLPA